MISANPAEFRQQTRLLAEELNSPLQGIRKGAAIDLAKISNWIHPADRPVVIAALGRMLNRGSTSSDFVFGLHAFAQVGSGEMPMFSTDVPIPNREDCIRRVFAVCAMDWVGEQVVPPGRAGAIAAKAVLRLSEGAPKEKLYSLFSKIIIEGNQIQKKLALNSVFSLDLSGPSLFSEVALSILDPEFGVRTAAEETFRKITRHQSPSFPRNIFLARQPSQAKSALREYLSSLPKGEAHMELVKKFAIIGAIRGFDNSQVITDILIGRSIISKEDIDLHTVDSVNGNKDGDSLQRMNTRRSSLKEKARGISHEIELLARPDGIPPNSFLKQMNARIRPRHSQATHNHLPSKKITNLFGGGKRIQTKA